jgi:hypothetical protein
MSGQDLPPRSDGTCQLCWYPKKPDCHDPRGFLRSDGAWGREHCDLSGGFRGTPGEAYMGVPYGFMCIECKTSGGAPYGHGLSGFSGHDCQKNSNG